MPEEVGALAWSPKADCIAVQQGAIAVLLEWPSGRRLRSFGRSERPLNAMRFSPSGKQLMLSLPGRLTALDVQTGEATMQVGESGESLKDLLFFRMANGWSSPKDSMA